MEWAKDLKAKMEIEIPNRTSNGYYNVKKYIVILDPRRHSYNLAR